MVVRREMLMLDFFLPMMELMLFLSLQSLLLPQLVMLLVQAVLLEAKLLLLPLLLPAALCSCSQASSRTQKSLFGWTKAMT